MSIGGSYYNGSYTLSTAPKNKDTRIRAGAEIAFVRYIAFANLTKSVGKYIQMLGRGTRLDPKTGKFSFKVLDFVDLCQTSDSACLFT
ncbi:hypothetical protein HZA55_09855 [Candidatus Poribacteria bacterium]|nr:hypothetical protein [Candidatus Poribacteria bacterium]